MATLRFNEVFVGLLILSFLSAFVIPARYTDPIRSVQKLFAPVAVPARKIGASIRARVAPDRPDDRAADDVKSENERLRATVLNLTGQLEEMRRINQEREQLGDMRPLCTPFRVVGNDPGITRNSLAIAAGTMDHIEPHMAALCPSGLAGRIERVGAGGAQVQLITDSRFQATVKFFRWQNGHFVEVPGSTPTVLRGMGGGTMLVDNVRLSDIKGEQKDKPDLGIEVGDYAVLADPDWPMQVANQPLGRIEAIKPHPRVPLFKQLDVRPIQNLAELRYVMVMNKAGM